MYLNTQWKPPKKKKKIIKYISKVYGLIKHNLKFSDLFDMTNLTI